MVNLIHYASITPSMFEAFAKKAIERSGLGANDATIDVQNGTVTLKTTSASATHVLSTALFDTFKPAFNPQYQMRLGVEQKDGKGFSELKPTFKTDGTLSKDEQGREIPVLNHQSIDFLMERYQSSGAARGLAAADKQS